MSHRPTLQFLVDSIQSLRHITPSSVADFVLHAPENYEKWWTNLLHESPQHVVIETLLVVFIIWLLFIRKTVDPKKTSKSDNLSPKEVEWLIESWQPEPLVPKLSEKDKIVVESEVVIESLKDGYAKIKHIDHPVLLASTFDFLGYSRDESMKNAAREALDKYGCGSCGPRGFYGTIDVHLKLEDSIAKFMGTDEAICYSEGASAVTSAIQAFAKKGDLLIVDEACAEPVLTGAFLSRATVRYFRHNDMEDLERILQAVRAEDKRLKRDSTQQRRFIVAEGLYKNTGDLCRLPEIMKLKEKYFYRLILDEMMSFGSLGSTGRGATEHFGLKPSDVEVVVIPLDTVLASVGGAVVGSREIVDHQRLSGAGYCFSASTAPFLVAAACVGIEKLQSSAKLIESLGEINRLLYKVLETVPGMRILSSAPTSVIHLVLSNELSFEEELSRLTSIVNVARKNGVAVTLSKFAAVRENRPSIMICGNALYSTTQIDTIGSVLTKAAKQIIN